MFPAHPVPQPSPHPQPQPLTPTPTPPTTTANHQPLLFFSTMGRDKPSQAQFNAKTMDAAKDGKTPAPQDKGKKDHKPKPNQKMRR